MTASAIPAGPRIFAADVQYGEHDARAAALVFEGWSAPHTIWRGQRHFAEAAPYEPGALYRRELPPVLALLEMAVGEGFDPDVLVVDAYATFGPGRPALGAHLHAHTGKPVVGVAKTSFRDAEHAEVFRGTSRRPLYVTTAGMDVVRAADLVRAMHGAHRIPTLLKEVDSMARRIR